MTMTYTKTSQEATAGVFHVLPYIVTLVNYGLKLSIALTLASVMKKFGSSEAYQLGQDSGDYIQMLYHYYCML
jgi:hypothetical protein